ncbi:hypothetical protein FACS1894187_15010 [Synergistales bacterium]|nr:hypothetical protein FACS1894187_15010 [Synergistales bacterium]
MKNLFETTDALGRKVICESDQWHSHIITSHPEMIGKIYNVESAVSKPDVIYKSDKHDDRDVYFQNYGFPELYIKVVVGFSSDPGKIITAFIQKEIRGNIDKKIKKYDKTKLS